jgi:hypothetical protein
MRGVSLQRRTAPSEATPRIRDPQISDNHVATRSRGHAPVAILTRRSLLGSPVLAGKVWAFRRLACCLH